MLFRGGHSKYNRYIQRFINLGGGIGDISIKKGGEMSERHRILPWGKSPPFSLPVYMVNVPIAR